MIGAVEFVVAGADVLVVEFLALFNPDDYDEDRIEFCIAPDLIRTLR